MGWFKRGKKNKKSAPSDVAKTAEPDQSDPGKAAKVKKKDKKNKAGKYDQTLTKEVKAKKPKPEKKPKKEPPPVKTSDKPCGIEDLQVSCSHDRKATEYRVLQVVADTDTDCNFIEMEGEKSNKASIKRSFGGNDEITAKVIVKDEASAQDKSLCIKTDTQPATDKEWQKGEEKTFKVTHFDKYNSSSPLDKYAIWPIDAQPKEYIVHGKGCDDVSQQVTIECYPNVHHSVELAAESWSSCRDEMKEGWGKWTKLFSSGGASLVKNASAGVLELNPKTYPPAGYFNAEWGWKESENDWRTLYELSVSAGLKPAFGVGIEFKVHFGTLIYSACGIPPILSGALAEHIADIILAMGAESIASITGKGTYQRFSDDEVKNSLAVVLGIDGKVEVSLTFRVGSDYICSASISGAAELPISCSADAEVVIKEGLFFDAELKLEPLKLSVKVKVKAFVVFSREKKLKEWAMWKDDKTLWKKRIKTLPRKKDKTNTITSA